MNRPVIDFQTTSGTPAKSDRIMLRSLYGEVVTHKPQEMEVGCTLSMLGAAAEQLDVGKVLLLGISDPLGSATVPLRCVALSGKEPDDWATFRVAPEYAIRIARILGLD